MSAELTGLLAKNRDPNAGASQAMLIAASQGKRSPELYPIRLVIESVNAEVPPIKAEVEKKKRTQERRANATPEYVMTRRGSYADCFLPGNIGKTLKLCFFATVFVLGLGLEFKAMEIYVVACMPDLVLDPMTGAIDFFAAFAICGSYVLAPFIAAKVLFFDVPPEIYKARLNVFALAGGVAALVLPVIYSWVMGGTKDELPTPGTIAFMLGGLYGCLLMTTGSSFLVESAYADLLDVQKVRSESYIVLDASLSACSYSIAACNSVLQKARAAQNALDAAGEHLGHSYQASLAAAQARVAAAQAQAFAN
ncbi:hypothetical protein [Botrimarina mediterranea]|uniref:hypothetical protein n=1 Tax=Botrimarina mediterranea TaxID=2528022 RepID=UPI0011A637DC|nr:hypothetical protein [Botrimarina mediterranea]